MMTTQTIAGHSITLTEGDWYIASRPFADRGRTNYPVTVKNVDGQPVLTINPLTYDQANDLINAFNNGPMSFDGRIW